MPISFWLCWLCSQRLMVPITEGSTTHGHTQNTKTVQPHFSPQKNPKSKQSFVCPKAPDLHFHTPQPQENISDPHKGDDTKEHSVFKRLGPRAWWNKEPHSLFLVSTCTPPPAWAFGWDSSSSWMMWSKTMRKSSQMWCSCGQLLLEKWRTSSPSPPPGRINTAATYMWSQGSSTTTPSNSLSENRGILDFSVRALASSFIHSPRCSSS